MNEQWYNRNTIKIFLPPLEKDIYQFDHLKWSTTDTRACVIIHELGIFQYSMGKPILQDNE